jgi:UvrD/REP helicase N-terminal domain/UvrD-like helicase C-terminal domain
MRLTPEQQQALDLFTTGTSLAIEAGAGTGKTSTLLALAESTSRRGQYIAFNKAIVMEAREKMPRNVRAHTAHSLAMASVGNRFRHRLNSERVKSWQLAQMLKLSEIAVQAPSGYKSVSASFLAGLTMRAVVRFCQSADTEPTRRHVPIIEGIDQPNESGYHGGPNNDQVAAYLVPFVKKAWADVSSPTGMLPYRHDHYLKLWQLSDPRIGADFILFDECQDANPVMLAIVEAQAHAQRVFVGDSQQQIYSFTGAINALQRIRDTGAPVSFLTQSFRFGPEVADQANRVLAMLDAELRLVGTESIPSVVGPVDDPNVILSRTNAVAVRNVLAGIEQGKRVALVGGSSEIVSFAKAAEKLMEGRRSEHPDLACFESWSEVQEYVAEDAQGSDLKLMVDLIDDFSVETILGALDGTVQESSADLIVSTAHKSKGREWNKVRLGEDFPEDPKGDFDEELRLLYVSVTRAKLELDIESVTLLNDDRRRSFEPLVI